MIKRTKNIYILQKNPLFRQLVPGQCKHDIEIHLFPTAVQRTTTKILKKIIRKHIVILISSSYPI